jgi:hypothetical protein
MKKRAQFFAFKPIGKVYDPAFIECLQEFIVVSPHSPTGIHELPFGV